MKTIILILVTIFSTFVTFAQKSKEKDATSALPVFARQYSCPMHSDIISDKPGKCSKCGMDLTVSKKEQMKQEATGTYSCPMHKEVVSNHEGVCAKCSSKLVVDRKGSKQAKTVYSCSMHSEVASNKTGKCPICGKELEKEKTALGRIKKS